MYFGNWYFKKEFANPASTNYRVFVDTKLDAELQVRFRGPKKDGKSESLNSLLPCFALTVASFK